MADLRCARPASLAPTRPCTLLAPNYFSPPPPNVSTAKGSKDVVLPITVGPQQPAQVGPRGRL